jgi:hypothetical protein
MNFCHISPTPHLSVTDGRPVHLVLAHLIEEDEAYVDYYVQQKLKYGCTIIMDNSAFEMYKQNRPMYDSSKLITMGERIGADYIVLSDYPDSDPENTIEAAMVMAPVIKEEGFGTFFVPQGNKGSIDDLLYAFKFAATSDLVDYIGVSILAAPLAYDVESGNKLQRFNSRLRLMYDLDKRGILNTIKNNNKQVHFLGMVDGPNEVMFMNPFKGYIDTWDSSAAVWLGLNGQTFDNTPTGRRDGKFEEEVNFNFGTENVDFIEKAIDNMEYIDDLCKEYL